MQEIFGERTESEDRIRAFLKSVDAMGVEELAVLRERLEKETKILAHMTYLLSDLMEYKRESKHENVNQDPSQTGQS